MEAESATKTVEGSGTLKRWRHESKGREGRGSRLETGEKESGGGRRKAENWRRAENELKLRGI